MSSATRKLSATWLVHICNLVHFIISGSQQILYTIDFVIMIRLTKNNADKLPRWFLGFVGTKTFAFPIKDYDFLP